MNSNRPLKGSPYLSISIVSHLQASLVEQLLKDFEKYCKNFSFEIILTLNLHEQLPFKVDDFSFPVKVFTNQKAQGFSSNHNQAFKLSEGAFFCVLNPDVRFKKDPFPELLACLHDKSVGVVAPLVINKNGDIENSARQFPTPFKILCKLVGVRKANDYCIAEKLIYPDWVGGMFMLFPRKVFEILNGFDQRYFLYYEDVDLCARLRLLSFVVALNPAAMVVHDARRSSHVNLRYLKWHLTSMMRFFCSTVFLKVIWQRP